MTTATSGTDAKAQKNALADTYAAAATHKLQRTFSGAGAGEAPVADPEGELQLTHTCSTDISRLHMRLSLQPSHG